MVKLKEEDNSASASKEADDNEAAESLATASKATASKLGGLMAQVARAAEEKRKKKQAALLDGRASIRKACSDELDRYKAMESLPTNKRDGSHSNPLMWWKTNQVLLPTLARLAKSCLAIQASSAPSEWVFSQASILISAKRTRLAPVNAGMQLFVKQSWKWFEKEVKLSKLNLEHR